MRNREAIPSKLKSGVVFGYKKWPHLEFAADDMVLPFWSSCSHIVITLLHEGRIKSSVRVTLDYIPVLAKIGAIAYTLQEFTPYSMFFGLNHPNVIPLSLIFYKLQQCYKPEQFMLLAISLHKVL
jgi:hypothetical protein